MQKIIILAETGSDISPELAEEYGIRLVPMHVSFGNITKDDGSFPPEEVCEYYEKTGKVPKTSGSNPEDFLKIFDEMEGIADMHMLDAVAASLDISLSGNASLQECFSLIRDNLVTQKKYECSRWR